MNDMLQSLIPAIYPVLKQSLSLSFTQVGLITLTNQATASLLQPVVGFYTDSHPKPYSLVIGMGCTMTGMVLLAFSPNFPLLLLAVAMVGMGSSVFHPESSRVARMASAGKFGLAQSIFQVGGNAGTAMGPLLAALVIRDGRSSVAWFSFVALCAMTVLFQVGGWYKGKLSEQNKRGISAAWEQRPVDKVAWPLFILLTLIFSKFFYMASLNSFFIFYLKSKFLLTTTQSQIHLFVFLAGVALGTILGGHAGDRFGRKRVIFFSILGVAPFSLYLPYASLIATGPLTFVIGLILSSAFPAILVYAQELFPGKIGMISGMFFGLAFGMAGIGAALLGKLADARGVDFVYMVCSYLPLLGLMAVFLPDIGKGAKKKG
jgi:FSR family fosmidomycin resistance protein-like MFS transporter